MTDGRGDLIARLVQLSPMPDDETATPEELDEYDDIVQELEQVADPRCIQPLIASFGYGLGFGVYSGAMHLLEKFEVDQVAPYLIDAVRHGSPGSRMWAARLLGRGHNRAAVPCLLTLLQDDHEFVRLNAVHALSMIGGPGVREAIQRLRTDPSPEVQAGLETALVHLAVVEGRL